MRNIYNPQCTSTCIPTTYGNALPTIGVNGNALELLGQCTEQTGISASGLSLYGLNANRTNDLNNVLALGQKSGVQLVQAAAGSLNSAMNIAKIIDQSANFTVNLGSRFWRGGLCSVAGSECCRRAKASGSGRLWKAAGPRGLRKTECRSQHADVARIPVRTPNRLSPAFANSI